MPPKTHYLLVAVSKQGLLMIDFEEYRERYKGNLSSFLRWVTAKGFELDIVTDEVCDEAHA